MIRKGQKYYEIDYTTLYNYLRENKITYMELSEMLGKEKGYISGVLTKNRKVSSDTLDQLCDLMGKKREELIAGADSVFNTTLKVEPTKEDDYRPDFETRMKQMLNEDPERRERFRLSNAYREDVEKGNDVLADIGKDKNEYKDKWERFVDCVCQALKECKSSVKVVDLVQIMVGQ